MGKDFVSLLPQWQLDGQFLNANSSALPIDLGMPNTGIPCALACNDAGPAKRASPAAGFPGLPNIKPGQLKEPHGWLYCLPRFQQGFVLDMVLHDKLMLKTNLPVKVPAPANEICKEANASGTGHGPKQFLVFDQTGNKMTMMFSSGMGAPIPRPNAWSHKPDGLFHVSDELRFRSDEHYFPVPNVSDDLDDDYGIDDASEMHEDSDEIDALLFSDDEDNYSDDGEETSTGHSPSSMTAYEKQDWLDEEDPDEVASSAGPVKRQKLSDSGYQVTSVTYDGNSVKPSRSSKYEDDAESSCAGGQPVKCSDFASLSGSKRGRKEKICETVNILQTILPGGKGKDAVIVLDEAINYLRTLKFKAESLGLSGGSR